MALDDDDKAFIAQAIAAGLTKFQADELPGAVSKAVGSAVAAATKDIPRGDAFDAKVRELTKPANPKPDPKPIDPVEGESEAMKQMRAQVAQMTAQMQADREARQKAEAAQQRERLHNATRQALLDQGADPKRVQVALHHLNAEGVVTLNESGDPVFRSTNEFGVVEDVAVGEGAKAFLGSDTGKMFLPATGANGTGTGVGGSGGPSSGPTFGPDDDLSQGDLLSIVLGNVSVGAGTQRESTLDEDFGLA